MNTRIMAVASVLSPLAGIAASLAGALPARGVEVPFTERVISTTADFAISVFATDVDGDTDVLSASFNDNKVAWYESDGGSPPSFSPSAVMCFCKVTLLFPRKNMSFDKKAGLPACALSLRAAAGNPVM